MLCYNITDSGLFKKWMLLNVFALLIPNTTFNIFTLYIIPVNDISQFGVIRKYLVIALCRPFLGP